MTVGFRPQEFWPLTPRELSDCARVYYKREEVKDRIEWLRQAWYTAHIINCWVKGRVQPKTLLPRFVTAKALQPVDREQRKKEMLETAKLHKKKAWMLFKGTADKPRLFGDSPEDEKWLEEKIKMIGKPATGDAAKVLQFINKK